MIIETIIKWLIPLILGGIFSYIKKELKENRHQNKFMKEAMISLLRSQIVSKAEKYMELGYLPDYARYCITDLLKQYKALGGNHGIEKLVEQCLELPPIKLKERGV